MPTYEYLCKKCNKVFVLIMSISEHEAKQQRCPKCRSTRMEQQMSTFQAKTSKKS